MGAASVCLGTVLTSCGSDMIGTEATPVAAITLTPSALALTAIGGSAQVTAVALDASGNELPEVTVTWWSSATGVASVGAEGIVTAVANGQATITASAGTVTRAAAVTVAQEAATISVTPPADTLTATGQALPLSGTILDANGNEVEGALATWSSADTTVVTVDDAGVVTAVGAGSTTVLATSGAAAGSATVAVLGITTVALVEGVRGAPYDQALAATGGAGSYAWSLATGSLPSGLSLDPGTGVIGGTPTVSGGETFTVRATRGSKHTDRAFTLDVYEPVTVTTTSLAAGGVRSVYGADTLRADGGDGSYEWTISAGALNAGLVLSTGGVISGVPITEGTSSFTARVTSASQVVERDLSIAVAPHPGGTAYALRSFPPTLTAIDLASATVTSRVSLNDAGGANALNDIAVTPGGVAYVVAENYNQPSDPGWIWAIDVATGTVTDSVPLSADQPTAIAITPNGARAYVTHRFADVVSVVELSTNTLATPVVLDATTGLLGIAIAPNGASAYVTDVVGDPTVQEGAVLVIDLATNVVTDTITVGQGPQGIAITPNGALAVVTNTSAPSGEVSVIDLATRNVTAVATGAGYSPRVVIRPNSSQAYLRDQATNAFSVLDLTTFSTSTMPPPRQNPQVWAIAFSPDGSFAYVTDGNHVTDEIDLAANRMTASMAAAGDVALIVPGS